MPRKMHCKFSIVGIQKYLTCSPSACGADKLFTTRLFFAIASPYAFSQFAQLLKEMQRNDRLLQPRADSIATNLRALGLLEGDQKTTRALIRANQVSLATRYASF